MRWLGGCVGLLALAAILSGGFVNGRTGFAAETVPETSPPPTRIILVLDSPTTPVVRVRRETEPPTIVLEFPGQQVTGTLPEHVVVQHGVVSTIRTRYRSAKAGTLTRIIDALHIELTGPFPAQVHPAAGRVLIEVDGPARGAADTLEISVHGGVVLSGLASRHPVTERFRAMQNALAEATPVRWTWWAAAAPAAPATHPAGTPQPAMERRPSVESPPRSASQGAPHPAAGRPAVPWTMLAGLAIVVGLVVGAGVWWRCQRRSSSGVWLRSLARPRPAAPSPGVAFVDQLVFRAFERQGYQLLNTLEVDGLPAPLRIIANRGAQSALLCLVNGAFYEKRTVDRFVEAMRQVAVDQGFLVASGPFTVPAQRRAQEARVTLMGREELVELLGAGATSEYVAKQLEGLRMRLEASEQMARQYAEELETLRRQRNEASWLLGEERARGPALEAQAAEAAEQLKRAEARMGQLETDVGALRKQWEESQWYLGEANARVRHLDGWARELEAVAQTVRHLTQERDHARRLLDEERLQREQLAAQLEALTTDVKRVVARERALRDELARIQAVSAGRPLSSERRRSPRSRIAEATVELRDRRNRLILAGGLRDLSRSGVGLDTERGCPVGDGAVRIWLRLPGRRRPITSSGQLVWQALDAGMSRYRSGCRFLRVSSEHRTLIEEALAGSEQG